MTDAGQPGPLLPPTARHLLARVGQAQRDSRAPGLVAGVVRGGGELVWSASRGEVAEPHTDVQHRIGSITKPLTAIAVLRLRDSGRLALSDRLEEHLPGTAFGDRTLRQLLSHTGGLSAESPGSWWERSPGRTLAELGLTGGATVSDLLTGTDGRFHYSNLGFGLLGEVVAEKAGTSWADAVHEQVLLPLGMTRTTPRPSGPAARGWAVHPWADVALPEPEHDHGAMAAAGQLWATLADLARFAGFLLGDGADVLTTDSLLEMLDPVGTEGTGASGQAYGLGLQVLTSTGRTLVGHGGSMPGFLAGVFVDRERGDGALVMRNATSGADGGLLADLLALLHEHEPAPGAPWVRSPAGVDLALLGPWFWGPAPYALRLQPDGLLALGGLGRAGRESRFRDRCDGTWVGLDGYFRGEVMTVCAELMTVATFVFTRTPYDGAQPVPGGVDPAGWR